MFTCYRDVTYPERADLSLEMLPSSFLPILHENVYDHVLIQYPMSLTAELFQEILDDDVLVDKDKLIAGARYGIPDTMRSKVWMYLLNVSDSSHHFEGQQAEERNQYYRSMKVTTFLHIKNAVNTIVHRMQLTELNITAGVSNVLCHFFSCDQNIHFTPGIVNMTVPLFIASNKDEVSTFFMLTNLLDRFYSGGETSVHLGLAARLAKFINMFMPELANHFASEALDLGEVFVHWFQFLHSTALPISCLLRLWDSYLGLGRDELMKSLLFVSLALVDRFMPKMLRMEHVEVKNFLSNLPVVDMDVLLIQAETMRMQFETSIHDEMNKDL